VALAPYLYIHQPEWKTVEIYDMRKQHQRLVQYALAGFVPAGTAMKKVYHVQLVEEGRPDDTAGLLLRLTPKAKEVADAVSEILLWVDEESWLPARQKIAHRTANVQLDIRYFDPVPDNDMPESLFRPTWPPGTEQVLK
jgi:outer membrane lipoprotein-sorting protein